MTREEMEYDYQTLARMAMLRKKLRRLGVCGEAAWDLQMRKYVREKHTEPAPNRPSDPRTA